MGASLQKLNELEDAIERGDCAEVASLIRSGVSVNAKFRQRSALYFAIEKDQTQIAEFLLACGASLRLGYFTETLLHCAAARGNVRISTVLLERGAKVNARNHNGSTPLWLATSAGHYDVVQLLLQWPGVYVDCPCGDAFLKSIAMSSSLCQAVCGQSLDICRALLVKGATVDLPDINGCTPLHHACCLGNAAIATLLIQHGCAVNCVDKLGYTPLHSAVSHDQCSVVGVLVDAGCDVNLPASGDLDFTPLHTAAKRGHAAIVSALCAAKGIHVDRKDRYSMTPLMVACKHSNGLCLRELLLSGADANSLNWFGIRPLSVAVCLEEDPRIKWRLQRLGVGPHANVSGGGDSNISAVEEESGSVAKENEMTGQTDQSDEADSSVERLVWSVVRTLGVGQLSDPLDILYILLNGGADLRMTDDFNKMAVEYAVSNYGLRAVLMLVCHGATLSDDLLKSFLASSYVYHDPIIYTCTFPLMVALMCTSDKYRRFFHRFSLYNDKLPPSLRLWQQPLTLAQSCRSVVRDSLTQNTSCSIAPLVQRLPVPKAVRQFLLLFDVLQLLSDRQWGRFESQNL